ncbi:hypothetical protein HMPREF0765_2703 [Sphingobacterium spiritivorum ATCC 33300]|uniref:Uncharacterized protein n=1 Tax=Sphingobacterium spiritivorum ATCC 33300 TaxID=525372 RepID=C2FZE7_SPHSI|nr:hypothetical protein HMPREF0765_2703 [Sphingobacterium spiritivorum ATCC 33300]
MVILKDKDKSCNLIRHPEFSEESYLCYDKEMKISLGFIKIKAASG